MTLDAKHLLSRIRLPVGSMMPAFDGATGWLNSKPLTPGDLMGKVVAVDFWTFTCINWLRTLPYIRAWSDTYADKGLVVIGVHTPEFEVEHDVDNIERAVREMGIKYPIAIDSGVECLLEPVLARALHRRCRRQPPLHALRRRRV
jgi:thiol-disulfide isomerase/thioredoxin